MSAELIPLPLPRHVDTGVDPARFAQGQREVFAGQNLHIGRSPVVHAVGWVSWLGELTLPAPACRQGYAGTGTHGELGPTRWPVTCRRCRRLHGETDDAEQPALFAL